MNGFDMGKGIKLVVKVSEKKNRSKTSLEMELRNFSKREDDENEQRTMNSKREIPNSSFNNFPNRSPQRSADSRSLSPLPVISKGRGFSSLSSNNSSLPGGIPTKGVHGHKDNGVDDTAGTTKSLPSTVNRLNSSTNNSNSQLMTPDSFTKHTQPAVAKSGSYDSRGSVVNKTPSSCNYCGKTSSKKCAVCRTSYCSQECQAKDWTTHKQDCKRLALVSYLYMYI